MKTLKAIYTALSFQHVIIRKGVTYVEFYLKPRYYSPFYWAGCLIFLVFAIILGGFRGFADMYGAILSHKEGKDNPQTATGLKFNLTYWDRFNLYYG